MKFYKQRFISDVRKIRFSRTTVTKWNNSDDELIGCKQSLIGCKQSHIRIDF